jgi:hypothetical protein
MALDTVRQVLYTSGDRKLIFGLSLAGKTQWSKIKLSNSMPGALQIDSQQSRLYCATREGLLFIFDISHRSYLVLVHMMKLTKHPSMTGNYCK